MRTRQSGTNNFNSVLSFTFFKICVNTGHMFTFSAYKNKKEKQEKNDSPLIDKNKKLAQSMRYCGK